LSFPSSSRRGRRSAGGGCDCRGAVPFAAASARRSGRRSSNVPDIVWKHYVPPDERGHIVCIACWRKLVVVTDDGAYQRAHGGPLALGCEAWRKRRGVPKDAPLDWFAFSLWREGVLAGVPDDPPARSR
jgi:hypothetical protein